MQEKPAQSAKSSMSIVEKMVRVYATTLTDAKLSALEEIRQRLFSALTATGLTEAQLEGLAAGTHVAVPVEPHPIDDIVTRAKAAAAKAAVKFPQPNYVSLKIAEEAGEVVRGCVHYAEKRMEWAEVEGEVVQLIAMLIRLVTEGDQINGVLPPRAMLAAKEG